MELNQRAVSRPCSSPEISEPPTGVGCYKEGSRTGFRPTLDFTRRLAQVLGACITLLSSKMVSG